MVESPSLKVKLKILQCPEGIRSYQTIKTLEGCIEEYLAEAIANRKLLINRLKET